MLSYGALGPPPRTRIPARILHTRMLRQVNAPAKFLDKWSGHVFGRLIGGLARALGLFGRSRMAAPPREILIVKF